LHLCLDIVANNEKYGDIFAGALSYAELGTLITKSGAEYHYMMAAMGRVVAYLFAWTKIIVLTPSSMAIICLTFAEYFMSLFDFCGEPQIPKKIIAALAMSKKPKTST
jgi:amino acid transporter